MDNAPAWSPGPGSNLIADHRLDPATGRSDTWVMKADGTSARNLTADLPRDLMRDDPAWSPDGRHIAFAWLPSEPGSGVWQLYTVRPDGTGMRLRTTDPAWGDRASPAWIPSR